MKQGEFSRRNGFSINQAGYKRANVNAAAITRQSKSNLALAFVSLGPERKRDITIFYAFCRVVDDIADSTELSIVEKRERLTDWRQMLGASAPDEPLLARDLRQLMAKYSLPPGMLEEIIAGVEMDLTTVRYPTFEELRVYCYRVASAVGLVSIEIFGHRNPRCREYAIDLGLALQMTNIIRDVWKDFQTGRIYLPQEDLVRFHYSEADLAKRRYNEQFIQLMQFQASRAREFFSRAARELPPEDRRAMAPAEIMRSIYRALLRRIELDNFRVFEKEYRLSRLEKAGRITAQLFKSFLNWPRRASV
ncbi:MAG TPA: squalene/phytoene synthase family protein [Candidatus Udaeobacter sp.]|nr:squalene/phytoene synthase family protein [Candidatus Udaeobacter sp.]